MGNSAANKQQNINNTNAGTLMGESQSLLPGIESGWESVMAPLSAADTAAIRNAGEGTTAGSYGSAQQQAQHTAATSGNPAGLSDLEDTLAGQKSNAVSEAALNDTLNIDQQNLQRQEAGLAGLSGVESGLQGGATSLYGDASSNANAQPNFWGQFLNNLVGAGATVGSAALKAGGCHVAAEIFGGWLKPETHLVRQYIYGTFAKKNWLTRLLTEFYSAHSEALSRRKWAVKLLAPLFRMALRKAKNGR